MRLILFTLAGLFILSQPEAFAQITISGKIADAKTGEPLPAAHVIIKGTYKGTIANADGEFNLKIETFPSTIVVRFLGYESQEQQVLENHTGPLDFLMNESTFELEEITVTGEDPAISIMKEVIRRKQIWREKLETYRVDAYTRQQLLNDTSIVSITESISEAFWDKKRGNREVLKSKRQTANMEGGDNFAGVSYIPNFYDDNLDIVEFDVIGVTHPDALKFYNFELVDYKRIDDNIVFEIKVSSKRKLQPLFEGTIHVLDLEYALIDVKLKPNSVIVFPPPIREFNMYYEQQFSNFGGDYWLPVDFRMEGKVRVGVPGLRFPPIGFKQISKLNDYDVNVELPDSLFSDMNTISVDSVTLQKSDSLFVNRLDVVPLTQKERFAYDSLDCNTTLTDEFRPTGFLTRFIDMDEEEDEGPECKDEKPESLKADSTTMASADVESSEPKEDGPVKKFIQDWSPDARYNRVDALYLGAKYENRYFDRRLGTSVMIGYSSGYEALNHGAELKWWPLSSTRRFAVSGGYEFITDTRYSSDLYGMFMPSFNALLGYDDYFDFYRKQGAFLGAAFIPKGWSQTFRLKYRIEDHSSINFKTSYDISGRENIQRINPPVQEGLLSSVELSVESGEGKDALGIIGADNILLSVEQSAEMLGSDWNFTKFKVDIYRRYNTFYKRRFIPNSLDFRLNAGTFVGDLPVQKNGALDAAFGYFTPFGGFKSQRFIPYEGASYIALNAEHNFRSVPLEALGWRNAAKVGLSIIAFGGIGKSWIPADQEQFFQATIGRAPFITDGIHSEVGISVSNIFSLFRIDFAYRLDEPGFYPGISVARLF